MQLHEYRKQHSLSRAKFGRLVGVTGIQVWRWETGRSLPRPNMMAAIKATTNGAVTADDHQQAVMVRKAAA